MVTSRGIVIAVSALLVLAGVCKLWGWPWAAIVTGLPAVSFYLYGEVRAVRHGAAIRTLEESD